MGGRYTVIVLVVLGLVGDDVDDGDPLDCLSPYVSGDDDTDGGALITLDNLAVFLMGDEDFVGWIHGPVEGGGNVVPDKLVLGFFLEGSGTDLVGEVLHADELDVFA